MEKPDLKNITTILGIMVFLFLSFDLFSTSAFAAQKNQCLKCHKNFDMHIRKSRLVSKKACSACHLAEQRKKHPKQKDSIKLKDDIPGLCYACHEKSKFMGQNIHIPVAEGRCTVCHDVHRSRVKSLLVTKTPELCYKCHDKAKFTGKFTHKVALHSCGRRCHNPHASEKPHLLSLSINDNCAGCHKAQGTGRHISSLHGGRIHPVSGVTDPGNPEREMTCTSCHNPHSSNFAKFLSSRKKCKGCHAYY